MYLQPNIRNYHKGTYQADRLPEALGSDYIKIDERSLEDLIRQSATFSQSLTFYDDTNTSDGDWHEFFEDIYQFPDEEKRIKGHLLFSSLSELEEKIADKPHLALLLSFLRLFKIEQDNLNTLTEKHLEFYYKEILGFSPKKGTTGNVTVFAQLNKNAQQAVVPNGTRFDAGKDTNGNPLFYLNKEDFIVNKGKVSSVFGFSRINKCYTNDLLAEENTESEKQIMHLACEKNAKFGFAISSRAFELKDGDRTIFFMLNKDIDISDFSEVAYTGEQGWETAKITNKVASGPFRPLNDIASVMNISSKRLTKPLHPFNRKGKMSVRIVADKPAIVAYDPKIHGVGYNTACPILRFTFKKNVQLKNDLTIDSIDIKVAGSKDFLLKNDFGRIENKANMQPFGAQPLKRSNLYFSSSVFSLLEDGCVPEFHADWSNSLNMPSKLQAKNGEKNVFQLSLERDLDWSDFSKKMFEALGTENKIKNVTYPQSAPFCKNEITLNYKFSSTNFQTFIFSPFGVCSNAEIGSLDLFDVDFESYVYIGIENLLQGDSTSLYFQLDQTQCDSQILLEEDNLEWYYLSGNAWKPFENINIVSDTTNGLRQSGIVRFKVSDDAFLPHDIMPQDKTWLRMSIKKNGSAYPALKAIQANAVELVFDETSEGSPLLGYGLPGSTISKTVINIPGVKVIQQPYDGSEGLFEENKTQFYTRVSERLRHKNRAWSAWDYERMVLEQFPSLAAVKCISCMNEKYEYSPGHILILLVPDCRKNPQKEVLKPKVGVNIIRNVETFLKAHSSAFTQIHVINPEYKTVTVDCSLTLRNGYSDNNYYAKLISEQLIKYIAPWSGGDKNVLLTNNHNSSQIAYFLEKLPYVDNIKELKVKLEGEIVEGEIVPQNTYTVLTSTKTHNVKIV